MRRMQTIALPRPARGLLAALSLLAAGAASASTVQLNVIGADGRPVPGAVVMVQPLGSFTPPPLPPTFVIEQREIRFVPAVTVVPLNGKVRFTNADGFDHHVRALPGGPLGSVAPAEQFDLRLPKASGGRTTSSPEILLDSPGSIAIGCHLHGSMRAHIYVSPTPFAAVSDNQGRVRIDAVPEGAVEIRLWHPDQLAEQAVQRATLSGGVFAADGKLNFTPRRRPPPRAGGRDEYGYPTN